MEKDNEVLMPEFERLLKQGYIVEFSPKGESMRPHIEGGRDSVMLQHTIHPAVGDIVLAKAGKAYVLHRAVKRRGDQLTLRGDGNLHGEEHCTTGDVLGKVISIIHDCGEHAWDSKPTGAFLWRHMPVWVKLIRLKMYRKRIKNNKRHEN